MGGFDGGWSVPGYEHIRELGRGAFGRVVLAVRTATGERVAIKYLGERLLSDQRFRTEFAAEARLLTEVRSPHVVRIEEYVTDAGGAAIVMELVDGIALKRLLEDEGATSPEAALSVLKGSLLGLAAAHATGVVHRDYKPDNVLVTAEGRSTLVDFGVAVRSGGTATAAGTPPYMAPEQWRTGMASPATDVYAATAVFYECVVGHRPFMAPTIPALRIQHLQAPIPVEQAPEPVRELIRRGLAKDPADRPAGAAAFVEEVEAAAAAAYGSDWEERGILALAALAGALAMLLPQAATTATTIQTAVGKAAEGSAGHTQLSAPVRTGRRGMSKAAKATITVGAAAAVVAAGGYAAVRSSSSSPDGPPNGATAAPAAVASASPGSASPSASPSPSEVAIPADSLVGTYVFKLKGVKITKPLNGQERQLVQRVARQPLGQRVRIQVRPGGGLQIRAGSNPATRLKPAGPGKFDLPQGAKMTVDPADLRDGKVASFTFTTPVFIIRPAPKRKVGLATYELVRR